MLSIIFFNQFIHETVNLRFIKVLFFLSGDALKCSKTGSAS